MPHQGKATAWANPHHLPPHTHTDTYTNTHTDSLSLSHTHTHTHTQIATHTHTHTNTHPRTNTHTHPHNPTFYLSISLIPGKGSSQRGPCPIDGVMVANKLPPILLRNIT